MSLINHSSRVSYIDDHSQRDYYCTECPWTLALSGFGDLLPQAEREYHNHQCSPTPAPAVRKLTVADHFPPGYVEGEC